MPVEHRIIQHPVGLDIIALLALGRWHAPWDHILKVAQHKIIHVVLVHVALQQHLASFVMVGIIVPLVRLMSSEELLKAALVLLLLYVLQEHIDLGMDHMVVQHVQQDIILMQGRHHAH